MNSILLLKDYNGGQLEIQNPEKNYVYRGEVSSIQCEDSIVTFTFKWLAKGPYPPSKWTSDDKRTHEIDLRKCKASDIGPGEEGDTRIMFSGPDTTELAVLFPANGSKLDPSRVEGIDLSKI